MGQMMDLMSQPQGKKGPEVLAQFSRTRLEQIYDYKTAFYSFYLPIACAMYIYGLTSPAQLEVAKEISVMLGRKFQAQDDFLDCFGNPEHIGKVGTDIQDHKCTWLLVNALELCSAEQRRDIIEKYLGKDDPESIAKIKQLYKDLGIEKIFDKFEDDTFAAITAKIEQSKDSVPSVLFTKILNKIHRRTY
jgi:farnesyl diphosphate synthase